jgi:signal transduction histidine kinase/ligand-binding sensor domain-containing protein/CheY-like chemotaxis protein
MQKRFLTARSSLLAILSIFSFCSTIGQQELNFTTLITKDGLSSNTINVILKDRSGLMWFGTADGLDKFDGTNFTIYRHDAQDPTSIPANEVLSMYEDKSGRIWVGTGGGGVAYYDPQHNSFVRYKKTGIWPNIDNIAVCAMCQDHNEDMWIGTYGEVKKISLRTNQISNIHLDYITKGQSSIFVVISLFEDRRQRMWIGTNRGLYLFDPTSGKSPSLVYMEKDPGSHSGNDKSVKSITEDANGNIWFGTLGGLNVLLPNGKGFRYFRHADNDPTSISSDNIYGIAPTTDNKLWLATEEGLNIFDLKKLTSVTVKPDSRNIFSLKNKSVRSIYIDKKGIFWLGTYRGGVSKYDQNLALFNLKQSNAFDPGGLASPLVTSFAEYKAGRIFVGSDGGGVQLFDRNTGLFSRYEIKSALKGATNHLTVQTLKLDRNGILWVGTFQHGLFQLNPATGRYKQYLAGTRPGDINCNDIVCLEQDSRGAIWIGTNGSGVNIFDPKRGVFTKYNEHPQNPGDLLLPLNGYISAITETKEGDIWLGSVGSGIAVFHPANSKFSVYNKVNSNLDYDMVLCIFQDQAGYIWVGTNGGGLNLFDKKSKKFISFSEREGLPNGIVNKILQDQSGLLWLSTDKGICSFDPLTKKFKNFNGYNGVQNSPFIIGAGMCSTRGEMYFGGQDGFNYFDPKLLPSNLYIPKVLLTDLKVSNNTVFPGENSPIMEDIAIVKDIRLAYGQNFSISYVALNYTEPQQNQYSYKLIGFDRDWNFVGTSKTAHYTNLAPGNYIFQVRASNNEGIWSGKITTIRIEILPPLWRTVYAYICYSLLAIGLFLYARNRSIRKIKTKFAFEQEKTQARNLIEQGKREAERLHELDLLKIKFLTNLSHEFRTPISLILAPADKLLSMQTDVATSSQVHVIKRNAKRLLNLVNQLLDFREMEAQELKLNLAPGDLITFIRDAADSFQYLSERKKIDLQFESEQDHLYASFDHDKVERIVLNLLSNAFKFTYERGSIGIHLSLTAKTGENNKQQLCFKVSDTGIGIPPDKQDKIFERFFQHDNAVDILNQGSGIGLSITKEFVELQGGKILIESTPDIGSTFIVYLPVIPLDIYETPQPESASEQREEVVSENAKVSDQDESLTQTLMASILLVEDNDDFRFYLKDNLKAYYQILEAANGKEGWQKTLSCHPQLIVSDISMPVMNGIEFSKKIKSDKRTSHIPVILLTAMTAEEDQIKGLETGANDYLTKPFNFEILHAKINNLLVFNRALKDTYSKQIQVIGEKTQIESGDAKLLNTIVKFIEDKLMDPDLSVEELSKHVCMSRGSLYHKLLELTGLTPIEYIRAVKLDKAAALLEKSSYNVAQVGYMTGFGTPSYFSRMFKAKFQILPSEYVNLKRKDPKIKSGTKEYE